LAGVPRIVLKPQVNLGQSQDLEEAKVKKSRKKKRDRKKHQVSSNEEDSDIQNMYRTLEHGKPIFFLL